MAAHCTLLLLILSLPPSLVFQSAGTTLAAYLVNDSSSTLQLSVGLNFTIPPSQTDISVGIATLDENGIFFPILSSPSFNSSNSSVSRGFSLGFYYAPYTNPVSYLSGGYNLYLAACAGLSGNYSNQVPYFFESGDYQPSIKVSQPIDGFVVPVWIANIQKPITDRDQASLVVIADKNNAILQLKDGNDTLWNVSRVAMMELRDSGDLLIYDNVGDVVWQSFNMSRDVLLEGQKLAVGGELRSNDSNYLARMEKGGLVLYFYNAHFGNNTGLPAPPPYWILGIFNNSEAHRNASVNEVIALAPCSNSPAFTMLERDVLGVNYTDIRLDPGACSNVMGSSFYGIIYRVSQDPSWSLLRLENDGRMYSYGVNNPSGVAPSVERFALDSTFESVFINEGEFTSFFESQNWGPQCGVPMACGPVGVCTSPEGDNLVQNPCSCPDSSYFEPRNPTDFSQGCKRLSSLPNCTTGIEHVNSTDFLELNSTASIFLFIGWNFSPFHALVADCKSFCSSNCSCHGFLYQEDIAACFYITTEFTLLEVPVKKILTMYDYALSLNDSGYGRQIEITATHYVTYLKVVPLHLIPSASDNSPRNNARPSGDTRATIALRVVLPTFAAFLVIGMACIGYRLVRVRRRKLVQMRLQAEEERELQDVLPLLPNRFSYKDLHEATKGFSNLLGAGGCGCVYLGVLQDGRKVAVKKLQVVLQGAEQSRQFLAEVGSIGRTNHHNIVRLYGFCWEISHRLLVYEYVERGSLDQWLFVDDLKASLDWRTRYNLALGIGQGVHYLHEECEQPILHFDVKPQNILLGDDFVPKLADFGLSRLMQRDGSSIVTGVRGTPGYIAPEWVSHGKVSKKSDIFSMGMVLLELVGGRKILDCSLLNSPDSTEQEAWHFPSWAASKCEQGLMMELVDKHLHVGGFDEEQLQRLIHIAFWCIHGDPAMRPSSLTVVQWLQGISPGTFPSLSTVISATVNEPPATNSAYPSLCNISM